MFFGICSIVCDNSSGCSLLCFLVVFFAGVIFLFSFLYYVVFVLVLGVSD